MLVSHGSPSLVEPTRENAGVALTGLVSLYTRISLVVNPDAGGAVGAGTDRARLDSALKVGLFTSAGRVKVASHRSTLL